MDLSAVRSASLGSCASNPAHLNAMRVVNQPFEGAIRQRWTADLFVPAQLRVPDNF
jgi:hypothetical protein